MTNEITSTPVLEFDEVTVRYPGEPIAALDRCSFRVDPGERVALLGANGSGKTTIFLATAGLVPHQGAIRVLGERLDHRRPDPVRRRVGLLFSNPEDQLLFPRVLDDVAFTLTSRGVSAGEAYERARHALAQLDAAALAERSPARLSRGERLRAALAGTLVADVPLLLLDEPSSGLDPAGKRRLLEHLESLTATLLIASHDIDFVRRCCGRYLLLSRGVVVASGSDWDRVEL